MVASGELQFGFHALDDADGYIELCAIPISAVSRVLRGVGVNGVPVDAVPPEFAEGDQDWTSFQPVPRVE